MSVPQNGTKDIAVRRPSPRPRWHGPFMALDKWWTEADAGPWGCPIGVELALNYRVDDREGKAS